MKNITCILIPLFLFYNFSKYNADKKYLHISLLLIFLRKLCLLTYIYVCVYLKKRIKNVR